MPNDAPFTAADVCRLAEATSTGLNDLSDGTVEITLPYLDRKRKPFQVGAYREKGKIVITDGGWANALFGAKGPGVTEQAIIKRFGMGMDGGYLVARVAEAGFAKRLRRFIQGLIVLDGLAAAKKEKANAD